MALEKLFNASDVIQSYRWMGHQGQGYTELLALHPAYKQGKEHFEENKSNGAFPKIWYATSEKQVLAFLTRYHGTHMCCYGVNPRPEILKNGKGYPRRAKDKDIATVKNFYFDFDAVQEMSADRKLDAFDGLFGAVDSYLTEKGIQRPVHAFSGNGYHLLFALPSVQVKEHEDISERINGFLKEVRDKFDNDMQSVGIKVDTTTDLSRMAKIYGSRKPGNGEVSRFHGIERAEDPVLLEYLLSLPAVNNGAKNNRTQSRIQLEVYEALPRQFVELLAKEPEIAHLWNGTDKNEGDTSRSGYDMSLMYACIKRGIKDVKSLSTILMLRKDGSYTASGKDGKYVQLTVAKALRSRRK